MDAPAHNAERFAAALAAESGKDAKIEGERILFGGREYFLRFHLEPATADELATVIRRGGGEKTVFASAFTKEAEALALSFGIELMDAEKSYALLQENDCLPENYIMGSQIKRSLKNELRLRLARKSWKGYLLAGVSLLLFSLISIFPVYYINRNFRCKIILLPCKFFLLFTSSGRNFKCKRGRAFNSWHDNYRYNFSLLFCRNI